MTQLCHPRMSGTGNRIGLADIPPAIADAAHAHPEPSDPGRFRLNIHQVQVQAEPRPTAERDRAARPAEPACLSDWIEDQAAAFKAQETQAGAWMAETMLELAATARFLGASTPEQFETRKQTLEQDRLSVRPCPKVVGRYQAWDVVDGRGKVVRACTDLFDAMMWIQAKLLP